MPTVAKPFPADLRMLTALRAVAALLVVLFHFADRTAPGSGMHTALIDNGQLGVDIFFVLSGFILSHVYLTRCAEGRFAFGDFLVNRLARLYPLHLLMLALAVGNGLVALRNGLALDVYGPLLGLDPATGGGALWNLITTLTLSHAWGTTNGHYFNSVSWSISAEMAAYLLFPLIAAASIAFGTRVKQRVAAAVMLYAACEITAQYLLGAGLNDLSWRYGFLRILPEFAMGVAVYSLGVARPLSHQALLWILPAALPLPVILIAAGAPVAVMPPVFAALILLIASAERERLVPPAWVLNPMVYLGEISYSTYMLHLILGKVYFNALARLAGYDPHALPAYQCLLALIPILIASALSYHLIEVPGRKLLRGLWNASKTPAITTLAAR
jgi:peptidoglycan/LPS O-acetylase OafA/YrhL